MEFHYNQMQLVCQVQKMEHLHETRSDKTTIIIWQYHSAGLAYKTNVLASKKDSSVVNVGSLAWKIIKLFHPFNLGIYQLFLLTNGIIW